LRIAVIPGDGIGKDVTAEVVKVVNAVGQRFGRTFDLEMLPYGADYYLETGITLPPNGIQMLRDQFQAIFIGALGDPRVPDMRQVREILLGIRFELDLYINQRPVVLLDRRLCPLKDRGPEDVNFVVFRENTEGPYVNIGGRFKPGTEDEVAIQEDINTYKGVHRIIKYAFEWAATRGLKRVCMSDKSNALPSGHSIWQRVFWELAKQYPNIEATHLYIDALSMQMVKNPGQFQVVVTNNMFGDIVTDLGAQLQGGLGLAASGNTHPGRTSMFEPVHGSAPKYAGKNVANPIGAILSAALMLEFLGLPEAAASVEAAVKKSVVNGEGTAEVGGTLGTKEAGDVITKYILQGS
jgi:3-isopropylmalate dehydrogenase